MCQNNYDNEFITEFEKFLAKDPNASLPPIGNEGVQGDYFLKYIEVHIKAKKCPLPCSRLWLVDIYSLCKCVYMRLLLQEVLCRQ